MPSSECFEHENLQLFFQKFLGFKSIYYTYQASKKQNEPFSSQNYTIL